MKPNYWPVIPGAAVPVRRNVKIDGRTELHMKLYAGTATLPNADGTESEFSVGHVIGGGLEIYGGDDETYAIDLQDFFDAVTAFQRKKKPARPVAGKE